MKEGHEIFLLSSRPASKSLVIVLLKCLKKYDIPFNKIIVSCNNKAVYCKENNIDILIDDSPYICRNAKKIGVDVILYNSNKNLDNRTIPFKDIICAKSWRDLDELIIKKKTNKIRR